MILTAGIDLSIGVIMVISSVVMGVSRCSTACRRSSPFRSVSSGGSVFGYLNGILVTRMRMPPFIVTLGTLSIIGALNTFYSQSETIGMQDIDEKAPFLNLMGNTLGVGGAQIMWGTFLMLLVAAVVWYVFSTAPPMDGMSMRPATIRNPRGSPASTPTAFCLAFTFSPASSPQSPAGR